MIDRVRAVWAVLDGWERLALVTLVLAALGQLLFVAKYLTRRWYDYRVGRALMGKAASLGVLLALSVIGAFYRLPEWITAVSIGLVTLFIWYQTYVLFTSPRYLNLDEEVHP